MSSNDKTEIKEQQPFSFALKAPKLKLMKPNITPTPFSLNDDSYSDEMDDSTDGDIPYDEIIQKNLSIIIILQKQFSKL